MTTYCDRHLSSSIQLPSCLMVVVLEESRLQMSLKWRMVMRLMQCCTKQVDSQPTLWANRLHL
ncbi:hypothetical protein IFM89_019753 [Coptis chinensis]|uniref:Uncharacterized protein n=1 Tax=Coptis chinensis TaxID=261450 RepID=A0A835H4C8_9MAGN|nr:hypothetical protein IFM89_019753 [Coptis chinensis]